jgi:hypothetical protein
VDTINVEALDGLTSALQALLPATAEPRLRPSLLVSPTRIAPAGVGAFVGMNVDPHGAILGARVEAAVLITARAPTPGDLPAAVTAVTRALLGRDRPTLLDDGILRIAADGLERPLTDVPDGGGGTVAEQTVRFRLLYEFLRLPAASEGVIREIPLGVSIDSSDTND